MRERETERERERERERREREPQVSHNSFAALLTYDVLPLPSGLFAIHIKRRSCRNAKVIRKEPRTDRSLQLRPSHLGLGHLGPKPLRLPRRRRPLPLRPLVLRDLLPATWKQNKTKQRRHSHECFMFSTSRAAKNTRKRETAERLAKLNPRAASLPQSPIRVECPDRHRNSLRLSEEPSPRNAMRNRASKEEQNISLALWAYMIPAIGLAANASPVFLDAGLKLDDSRLHPRQGGSPVTPGT